MTERIRGGDGPRRWLACLIVLCGGLGLLGCESTPPIPEVDDDVLAVWDGGEIRVDDLDAYLLSLPVQARFPDPTMESTTWLDQQVRDLFERQTLLAEIDAQAPDADPAMASNWERRARVVLSRTWMAQHDESFELTPDEVREAYEQTPERWKSPERRAFRHFLRTFPQGSDDAAKDAVCAEVETFRQRIEGGASFENLTLQYSQSATAPAGGMVAPVSRKQLRGDAGEMIFSLEAGQVSPVLRNRAGCQLFLVLQVVPAVDTSFELAQEVVAGELVERRRIAWHLDKLRSEAERIGVELPDWLDGHAPTDLTVDAVLFEHDGVQILAQDLASQVSSGIALPLALQNAIGDVLFSAALREEDPELAEKQLATARQNFLLDRSRRRSLLEFLSAQEETLLRERYERKKSSYQSDPKQELMVYSWPIGGGDPVASLERPRALVRALSEGEEAAEVWARFEGDSGVDRQALPQLGIRQLVQRYPVLATAILEPREEGEVVGPFRCGNRICVTQVEVLIPPRQLSFLEVQDQVRTELIREEGAAMEIEWSRELEAQHGLQLFPENLAGFGERLAKGLQEGAS